MIEAHRERLFRHLCQCAAFAALWQCASMALGAITLPSPMDTLKALVKISSAPDLLSAVLRSMTDIALGFLVCALSSAAAVAAAHAVPHAEAVLSPFVSLMKSVPIAVLTLLLLVLFASAGISPAAVFLASFPILYTSLLTGIRAADEKLLQMARVFGWSPLRTWRFIRLPAAADHIRSAVSVSSSMAWKAGLAAEIIGAPPGGIGAELITAKIYLITDEMFAWVVVLIILGRLTEKLAAIAVDALMRTARVI